MKIKYVETHNWNSSSVLGRRHEDRCSGFAEMAEYSKHGDRMTIFDIIDTLEAQGGLKNSAMKMPLDSVYSLSITKIKEDSS